MNQKECGTKQSSPILRYYIGIFLKGLRISKKIGRSVSSWSEFEPRISKVRARNATFSYPARCYIHISVSVYW